MKNKIIVSLDEIYKSSDFRSILGDLELFIGLDELTAISYSIDVLRGQTIDDIVLDLMEDVSYCQLGASNLKARLMSINELSLIIQRHIKQPNTQNVYKMILDLDTEIYIENRILLLLNDEKRY